MKERPILFSAQMVRAILAGTKTQTRRLIKPVGNDEGFVLQDYGDGFWPYRSEDGESGFYRDRNGYDTEERIKCPYGRPGDRIWVREAFDFLPCGGNDEPQACEIVYWSTGSHESRIAPADYNPLIYGREKVRPSIHMPRWASRITLEVTGVKVERLQDISEADAIAEGIGYSERFGGYCVGLAEHFNSHDPRESYRSLWNGINGPGSWDANPHVWCVSFKRLEAA